MQDINIIYAMLRSDDRQTNLLGMQLAGEVEDLSLLIMPLVKGCIWGNCAKVLSTKSDEALEPFLPKLLEWLHDLNWDGALTILERLKMFSGSKLKIPFINAVNCAINSNDEDGLMWLDYLSDLFDNAELLVELPEEILVVLKQHYNNWGAWRDDYND